ncbi:MAG: hypothetical protein OXE77_09310 [Flavobacteriaceae bacterium]|nr:hypothetical protein [Flavobacteriaceae bacterium]MCY4266960.1 hypothetical protein [Flavobacteriaceae bacterium]
MDVGASNNPAGGNQQKTSELPSVHPSDPFIPIKDSINMSFMRSLDHRTWLL